MNTITREIQSSFDLGQQFTMTEKGEVVLDQFAGSCNLGIACLESGRSAVLIEKDEKTYKAASKRLSEMFL